MPEHEDRSIGAPVTPISVSSSDSESVVFDVVERGVVHEVRWVVRRWACEL